MVTSTDFEYMLAVEAIAEREGQDVLNNRIKEGGRESVTHHFDNFYRVLPFSATDIEVVHIARALLGDAEFLYLLDQHHYGNAMDVLADEGVVSSIGQYFIVSTEYRVNSYPELR